MRAPHQPQADDVDLKALGAAMRAMLARLALVSALAGALTFLVLSLMAPRYVSEAQLTVAAEASANPFADPTAGAGEPDAVPVRMETEAINAHVRALLSPDLVMKIAGELNLGDRREFNSALGSVDTLSAMLRFAGIGAPRAGESEHDRVLSAFFDRVDVYSPKESHSIDIRVTSIDPELAAEIANRLAEAYRQSLAAQTNVEPDEVQEALEPKIAKLADEVAAAEAEADRFRGSISVLKGGQQATGLNEQQLGELTAELSKVKAARSEAEARTKSAREMLRQGAADTLPDVQRSPLIQNLVQQRVRIEREISELSATLLAGHPRMRQLNADLAGLRRQIDAEIGKVVDGLEKEAKVAALREESLTKSLNEVKASTVNTDEVKLRNLEAIAKSKRAELERLQAQYAANRARADSRAVPVEAQIVTRARPSGIPSFPRKGPYALLVMAGTFIFGLALVITGALFSGGARSRVRWGRRGADNLAVTPELVEPDLPVVSASRAAPQPAGEDVHVPERTIKMSSMSRIASFLATKAPGIGGYRALVAGESEGIDIALEALELANGLAATDATVIIVDWSPDGEGAAETLGLAAAPGMRELLDGGAGFEDVVTAVAGSAAHAISSGAGPWDPALLDPDRINLVLDALDEAYDFIVVAARHDAARTLFETIQGRFDAGVIVGEAKQRVAVIKNPPDTFLGYEVDGIELIRFERQPAAGIAGHRFIRTGQPKRHEARAF